jgi:dTMP kinase
MTAGRYIVFEGAEGCGKSTHASRLARRLDAVLTRETGGTPIGERIRRILHDTAVTDLSDHAEALLIAADRAQHIDQVVGPGLAAGRHVVSDRSVYSTLAYQGYGRGLPIDEIRSINEWALRGAWPDLVLLIDTDPAVLRQRMRSRQLDRFEAAGDDFHARVREGFAALAAAEPSRWVAIDGNRPIDAVAADITTAVAERLAL